MSDDYIQIVSDRYIEFMSILFMDEEFVKADVSDIQNRIAKNVLKFLKS
jgi:phosphoribosylaminoimidazole-succinocarboxamide synthase